MPTRTLGPTLSADGVTFRLWAPAAKRVELVLDRPACHAIACRTAGTSSRWRARVPARATSFASTARSRCRTPLRISSRRTWRAERGHRSCAIRLAGARIGAAGHGRRPCCSSSMSGTFTPGGSFRAAIEQLDHVVDTGMTAIELMPLADFAGRRNWGYDGVLLYAPDSAYGRPDDLQGADRCRARARADGVARRRLQSLRTRRELSLSLCAGVLRPPRIRHGAARSTIASRRCALLRSRMRCTGCEHYRFDGLRLDAVHAIVETGRAADPGGAQPRGRRALRHDRPADPPRAGKRRQPRAPARSAHQSAAGQISRAMERRLPSRLARAADRRTQGLLPGLRRATRASISRACSRPASPTRASCRLIAAAGGAENRPGALPPRRSSIFCRTTTRSATGRSATASPRKSTRRRSRPHCRHLARADAAASCSWARNGDRRAHFRSSAIFTARSRTRCARAGAQEFKSAYAEFGDDIPDPLAEETFRSAVLDWDARDDAARDGGGSRWCASCWRSGARRSCRASPARRSDRREPTASVLSADWRLGDGSALHLLANLSDESDAAARVMCRPGIRSGAVRLADRLAPWSVFWSIGEG